MYLKICGSTPILLDTNAYSAFKRNAHDAVVNHNSKSLIRFCDSIYDLLLFIPLDGSAQPFIEINRHAITERFFGGFD